jgi:hypothetical protein
MFINVLGWRTSPWAMAVGMSAALLVTVGWRMAGLSDQMMEAFPGFVSGLVVHWLVLAAVGFGRS